MAARLILFPDTNVFLQCRALHEVPWGDAVQADEIELLIGAPDYSGIRSSFVKRDRHMFYRREQDERPVTEASFTCEEFRHQRPPEVFSLWIIVPIQSEGAKATLHVRASARNITTPIDLYVPIHILP